MDADFWLQRWREGQIGFHRGEVMPLLEQYWPSLDAPAGSRVFVPLAGKTLDMHWLAAQGLQVLGCELSPLAVEAFFAEAGITPQVQLDTDGSHHRAGAIDLVQGDVFALREQALATMDAFYDRAALIALPPELRLRYAHALYAALPTGCRGLLVTLEYPQAERAGPPFSVQEDEVQALYAGDWTVDLRERRPILADHPGYVGGASRLDTAVYGLARR